MFEGGSGRSQKNSNYGVSTGSAPQTYRGSRSPKNTAAEEVISFIQPVTDSNIEKNEVIVKNADHIVLKLITPEEDEVEPFSPGGQVQYGGGSGLRGPKVEGSSKYSSRAGRGQKGQAWDK